MEDRIGKALSKLRVVMRSSGWTQVEVAEKIGVTQKTFSFWMHKKSRPSLNKVLAIEELCNKYEQGKEKGKKGKEKGKEGNTKGKESKESKESKDDEFATKILKGILLEAEAGKEFDERDKIEKDKHREYYNGKVIALSLEEKNRSRLILYPSLAGIEDEWYKMGGQSALFYKYIVGPRLKKKPVIRKDNDLKHRFKRGIVSVHWGEKFMKDVNTIGLKAKKIDYGLIVVEMEKEYTANEILEMYKREQADAEKVKKIIMPKKNFPDIYGLIRQLAQILPPKIKKMDGVYREAFGMGMLKDVASLTKIYFKMANGRMPEELAREEMFLEIDNITAVLAIADENQLFDLITRTKIGETLVDLKAMIKKRLG